MGELKYRCVFLPFDRLDGAGVGTQRTAYQTAVTGIIREAGQNEYRSMSASLLRYSALSHRGNISAMNDSNALDQAVQQITLDFNDRWKFNPVRDDGVGMNVEAGRRLHALLAPASQAAPSPERP